MPSDFLESLACPRDHQPLQRMADGSLACASAHRYPVVEGVPVLLLDESVHTLGIERSVLRRARGETAGDARAPELYLESLGLSDDELEGIARLWHGGDQEIDPVVQYLVAATCGIAYKTAIGRLAEYPIPEIALPPGEGRRLLDIGCNWGRWSVAAARKGYRVVGVDPQLGAIMAARRVARQLGLDIDYACADARCLPFVSGALEAAFSYSVLQHFSRADCLHAVREIGRVLRPGGLAKVQMANALGIRSAYHLARRGFREARGFEVRYYLPGEMLRMIETHVGRARLLADCFFGLGLQTTDAAFMGAAGRLALRGSEALKGASRLFVPLQHLADSVYVEAVRS
jgi:SAM-dependent methyltransferase